MGTGAGRAGDKVKRSSRLRDLEFDLEAEIGREEEGGGESELQGADCVILLALYLVFVSPL